MTKPLPVSIYGEVKPEFESVRRAFVENFNHRHELGGACCIYYRGEKVVDIWGGVSDKRTGRPWEKDTMVLVYSATKGLAAMVMALAHSRDWLDYDEKVCAYWPEFVQNGKETITLRQLLDHKAALFAINESINRDTVADLNALAMILARQKPEWEPGLRIAYHALTLGFYENEIIRRTDPQHRSLGQVFQDEIATPLGIECYIRVPETIANSQLATLAKPNPLTMIFGFPLKFILNAFNRRSNIYRALSINPGSEIVHDQNTVYARNLEVPSGGGVTTARGMAKAYSVFAGNGAELHLKPETLRELVKPATPAKEGFFDHCMLGDTKFHLGFMQCNNNFPFGSEGSFGAPGAGGAMGFADPTLGVGYAYVTSKMGASLTGDPRDIALRDAFYGEIQ